MKRVLFLATALLLLMAPMRAKAQQGIENYVSASGYVLYNVPVYYSGYYFDFEEDFEEGRLLDWTTIDADGDGHTWQVFPQGGYGLHHSDGMAVSYSYDNASSSPLTPDNFLVSPRITIPTGGHIHWYMCALDEAYPAEHIGIAISTENNTNPSDFTLLWQGTLSSKSQPSRQIRNVSARYVLLAALS